MAYKTSSGPCRLKHEPNLLELLCDAGLDRIQIGSFVNPRKVPQMAGTDKLWRLLTHAGWHSVQRSGAKQERP